MLDPVVNFGKVYASLGYNAAAVTIVLTTGQGALLPQPSTAGAFNMVWWNYTDYSDPSDDPNVEIVRVTARTADTLTVTRAQEGTTASTKNSAGKTYALINAITKKMIDDLGAGTGATWGSITGSISAQTDLQTALSAKGNLAGGNIWTGGQSFSGNIGVGKSASSDRAIDVLTTAAGASVGVRIENDDVGNTAFATFITGDSNFRFDFDATGNMEWGSGAAGPDVQLYRVSAGNLYTSANFIAQGTIQAVGSISASNLSGTNTGNVSLAGETYITIAGQVITAAAVNLSGTQATGTLAAARMPALTGDVTSTVNTVGTTIANSAVTLAKMADVATATVFYRKTTGSGAPEVQTLATLKTDLGLTGTNSGDQTITLTSDVTGSGTGSFAATIANSAVTLAKMANMATASLIYRKTAGTGAPEVNTLATLKTDLLLTGTNSGDVTIGTFGTSTNVKGISISGQVITLTPAGSGNPGAMSTGTQSISGSKTFIDLLNVGSSGLNSNGPLLLNGASSINFSVGGGLLGNFEATIVPNLSRLHVGYDPSGGTFGTTFGGEIWFDAGGNGDYGAEFDYTFNGVRMLAIGFGNQAEFGTGTYGQEDGRTMHFVDRSPSGGDAVLGGFGSDYVWHWFYDQSIGGTLSAAALVGDGSGITGLNASALSVVPLANGGTAASSYTGTTGSLVFMTSSPSFGTSSNLIYTASTGLLVIQGTVGNAVHTIQSTATNDDPAEITYQDRVATTDATVTTLHTFIIPSSTTYMIEAKVTARRTGGVSGTAEDGAGYVIRATYKNVSGTTATLIGSVDTNYTAESQAAWDATFAVSGTSIFLKVTGAAANNVTWHMTAKVYKLST